MNRNGQVAIRNRKALSAAERMAEYDNLQPEVRKLLQEAPYSITLSDKWIGRKITSADINSFRRRLVEMKAQSALLTYGRNHPEAAQ